MYIVAGQNYVFRAKNIIHIYQTTENSKCQCKLKWTNPVLRFCFFDSVKNKVITVKFYIHINMYL